MRILLIGATWFIGTHLVRPLSDDGHEVTVFHRGVTNPGNIGPASEILGDRQHLWRTLQQQFAQSWATKSMVEASTTSAKFVG